MLNLEMLDTELQSINENITQHEQALMQRRQELTQIQTQYTALLGAREAVTRLKNQALEALKSADMDENY